jgi:glycosyltransferase 2 family protein
MTEETKHSKRWWIVQIVLVTVAFGLLAVAVWSNRKPLRDVFSKPIDARLLVIGFGVYFMALLLTFVRWFFLVRALNLPFRLADAMRLGFIGNVYNLVIPGAVGGDLVKAAFLCKEHPENKTRAVSSMVIDRIVGLLGLFILASLGGAAAWSAAPFSVRTLIIVAWVTVACGFLGLAILFTPALYRPFERLLRGRGKLSVVFGELIATSSAYRGRVPVVAVMLALAAGIHTLYTVAFYAVSLALFGSQAPGLGQHLVIVPLTLFTQAVPLPFGALGLTENVSSELFKLVGHPGGAVAMMGYRVLMYAGGLLSAIVYAANARQVRKLASAPN